MLREKFETINGFEDYEVSNFGYVISHKKNKDRILKMNHVGVVNLWNSFLKKRTCYCVHHLVWDYFGDKERDGNRLVVRFKDGSKMKDESKKNCRIDNLFLQTANDLRREPKVSSSGQHNIFKKAKNKFQARISLGGRCCHLGNFDTIAEAKKAVKDFEKKYRETGKVPAIKTPLMERKMSKYRHIYFNKNTNEWRISIKINGKRNFIEFLKTEEEALIALQEYQEDSF